MKILFLYFLGLICFENSQAQTSNNTYCSNYEPGGTKYCCVSGTCPSEIPNPCIWGYMCESLVCRHKYPDCYPTATRYYDTYTSMEFYCASSCLATSDCVTCNPGYYNRDCGVNNSGSCVPCPPNKFCTGQRYALDCIPISCPVGNYLVPCNSISNAQCLPCPGIPLNSAYDIPTTSACTWTCNSGYYRSMDTCLPCSNPTCPVGQYPSVCIPTKDSTCISCTNKPHNGSIYTSNSTTGNNNCNWNCIPGYYGDMLSTCVICDPGTYTIEINSKACIPCAAATYNNASGMTFCYQCVTPTQRGKYLGGCQGASPGTIQQCTN
jgi:hypothetical protein